MRFFRVIAALRSCEKIGWQADAPAPPCGTDAFVCPPGVSVVLSRLLSLLVLLAMAIPSARAANLPRPSPDFAINLGQGKQVRISQYKGKTVVVVFILT